MTDLCCIIKSLYDDDVLGKKEISFAAMAATAPEELREMNLSDSEKLIALILLTMVERIERSKKREELYQEDIAGAEAPGKGGN